MYLSRITDHNQFNFKIQSPSQEPSASSKTRNKDLKDKYVILTFETKIKSKNLKNGFIKDPWPYQNHNQDAELQSGASSILKSPKSRPKGHDCLQVSTKLSLVLKDATPIINWYWGINLHMFKAIASSSLPLSLHQSARNLQCNLFDGLKLMFFSSGLIIRVCVSIFIG